MLEMIVCTIVENWADMFSEYIESRCNEDTYGYDNVRIFKTKYT